MDYVILNDMALQLTTDLVIEDHPPKQNAKNFHAHLALLLMCRKESTMMEGASIVGDNMFIGCWVWRALGVNGQIRWTLHRDWQAS